jgi:4-hydroxybenzoate polyprenyltransferase
MRSPGRSRAASPRRIIPKTAGYEQRMNRAVSPPTTPVRRALQSALLFLVSLRPRQWPKNLFVFAALFFSRNIFDGGLLLRVTAVFIIFCLLSGVGYVINDVLDRKKDAVHPLKAKRPIASGGLGATAAAAAAAVLAPLLLVLSYLIDPSLLFICLAYLSLSVLYTLWLKHIVILDIIVIALGFILRVEAGAVVIGVVPSLWLMVCTFLLALFLALAKRRHEIVALEGAADTHRYVLAEYSAYLLDQMIAVVTASTLLAYILYTISEETVTKFGTSRLIVTVPFVVYGIFRYLYLVHRKQEGGSPESVFFTDKPFLANTLLWGITVGIILYG